MNETPTLTNPKAKPQARRPLMISLAVSALELRVLLVALRHCSVNPPAGPAAYPKADEYWLLEHALGTEAMDALRLADRQELVRELNLGGDAELEAARKALPARRMLTLLCEATGNALESVLRTQNPWSDFPVDEIRGVLPVLAKLAVAVSTAPLGRGAETVLQDRLRPVLAVLRRGLLDTTSQA